MALERVLIDMSRDMQDVGFYTGEYAAKKRNFEEHVARSVRRRELPPSASVGLL